MLLRKPGDQKAFKNYTKTNFMKTIFTVLILISNWAVFSQTQDVAGSYQLTLETKEKGLFEYELVVHQDGTFFFHYHSNIEQGMPPESDKYGKGSWTVKNNVITLSSDRQKDLDEKHTLNFTNTKARFITKSPRDKTDRIVKPHLKFLESEIFWIKGIDLFKI